MSDYLFHLPFYELLQQNLMLLVGLVFEIVFFTYFAFGLLRVSNSGKIDANQNASRHLSVPLLS